MKISEITAFLEYAYDMLNAYYFNSELTKVVITVQSSAKTYGHYTTYDAWTDKNRGYREINISAETLDRPIENVIATLLHESTHHYCDQNNIKDVSRNGTYHNKRFKEQAELRGLLISYDSRIGYSITQPSPDLIQFISDMGWKDIDLSRKGEWDFSPSGGGSGGAIGPDGGSATGKKKSSTRKYLCPECGCSVRATKDVHIACLDCNTVMEVVEK